MTDSTYCPKDILVEHLCKLANNISFSFKMNENNSDPAFPEYHWTMNVSFFNAKLLINSNWHSEFRGHSRELNKFRSVGSVSIIHDKYSFIIISKNNEYIHFSNKNIELDIPKEYIEIQLNNAIDELSKIALHLESLRCPNCNILTGYHDINNLKCSMCKFSFE